MLKGLSGWAICCGLVLWSGGLDGVTIAALEPQGRLVQAQASEADQLFLEGFEQFEVGTAESLQTAILRFEAAVAQYRQDGERVEEALTLIFLGHTNHRLGYYQNALEAYEDALHLWQNLGDPRFEAITLNSLAQVHIASNNLHQALNFYNQAVPIFQEIGDRDGEAAALYNTGHIYDLLSNWQQALDFYNQALLIIQDMNNRVQEATVLTSIGMLQHKLGNRQQALDLLNQALTIRREAGDRNGEAITLNGIGAVYSALGEKQQALEIYNQALLIHQNVGNRFEEATTLSNIAGIHKDLGNLQQALDIYDQALTIRREVSDRRGEAITLNNLGTVYSLLGEEQQALEIYNQALIIRQEVGDRSGEATSLANIGGSHLTLGNRDESLDFLNQALVIFQDIGDRDGEAATLNWIGGLYDVLGQKQQALETYNQSLLIRQEIGDRTGEAVTRVNIGTIYDDLGDREKALDYLEDALSIFREVGDRNGEATTLNNIGQVSEAPGDRQQAVNHYIQALRIFRDIGNRSGEAGTLINIGAVYHAIGEQQQALDFYDQALSIISEVGDREAEARSLQNIGRVYNALGNQQQALDFFNQALPISREIGDRSGEAVILSGMGIAYRDQNDPSRAIELLEQSLDIVLELRSGLQQDFRDGFIQQSGAGTAIALADLLITENQPARAFEWLNRVATYELADYNRLQGATVSDPDAQAAIDAWNVQQQRLDALRQSIRNPELPEDARQAQIQELRQLEEQANQAAEEIADTYPEAAELFETTPEDIATLQANIPAGTVVVQPVLLTGFTNIDESLAIFILTRDQPIRVVRVPIDGEDTKALIREFRAAVENPSSSTYRGLGGDLYELLIQPIKADLDELRPTHIAIITTDELRQIPFEALWDRQTEQYLIEQYPIHYLTRLSSRSLLSQSDSAIGQISVPFVGTVALSFGTLAFGLGLLGILLGWRTNWKLGGVVLILAGGLGGYHWLHPSPQVAVLAFGNPRPEEPFGLPGTEQEVNDIRRLAPDSQIYLRQAATLAQFKQDSPRYAYLHLATHGCFQTLGCDLSQDESWDMSPNTLLFADESYALKDAALLGLDGTQLVVLSACQTATETELDNRAIAGLAYLWERAGAQSVMANLWPVADEQTADLMSHFYDGLLNQNQSRAVALQEAKQEVLADNPHPFYWAALQLIGDGR